MRAAQLILFLLLLGLLASCANTRQARDVQPSGFLGADAAKLQKGGKGRPARYYSRPGVDWSKYDKMLLDPVTFWDAPDGKDRGISQHDAQQVVNYFHDLINSTFSKEIEMVDSPQPGTIRAKVAITKLEKSHVVLDLISTVEPQAPLRAAETAFLPGGQVGYRDTPVGSTAGSVSGSVPAAGHVSYNPPLTTRGRRDGRQ
jgi:hypothetical protein